MSTLQERLLALADPQYGLARGFDDAQATINEAADALDAAERYAKTLEGQYQRMRAELDRILPMLDAAEAKLAAIDALHRKHTVNCLPMDCYNGNCDHEDDCPEVDIDVCDHCMSHTEVVTDEWFPASVEWPCPTHRILHPEEGTDE